MDTSASTRFVNWMRMFGPYFGNDQNDSPEPVSPFVVAIVTLTEPTTFSTKKSHAYGIYFFSFSSASSAHKSTICGSTSISRDCL